MGNLDTSFMEHIVAASNLITMGKKYQTRGNEKYPSLPVRILATDMKGVDATVIGLITEPNGWQYPACWMADGKSMEMGVKESYADLVPVPTKHEGWILVSKEGKILMASTIYEIIAIDSQPFRGETVHKIVWED